MSTRCQIGFYDSADQNLMKPSALLYRHSDGYPEGVLPDIVPFCERFELNRGMDDIEYLAARLLQHLTNAHDGMIRELSERFPAATNHGYLGYGISADFHGDLEYYYALYATGELVVHEVSYDRTQDLAIRLRELEALNIRENVRRKFALQRFLTGITEKEPDSLRAFVAAEALAHADDPAHPDAGIEGFFQDLSRSGCASGMVSGLIYYRDTHAFYDRFYEEIEQLREEWEESAGEPLPVKHDLKNFFAWFAFELTAERLWESATEQD